MKLTPEETLAHTTLTDKQWAAWILWNRGAGYVRIANMLNISTSTARDRVRRANHNLTNHPAYQELAA